MSEVRAEQILDAALDIIGKQGSHRVTLEGVGKRVGLTKSAIYHYFANKQDMVRALIMREGTRMMTALERAAEHTADPATKLRAILRARAEFLSREGGPLTWSLETALDIEPIAREVIPVLRGAEQDLYASVLRQGNANGKLTVANPDAAAKMLSNCLHGFDQGTVYTRNPRAKKEQLDALLQMVLEGFLARGK
ncbi:MAG TPA: TetR/AcrR family transcriptional regulator [Myxococcota bacterium]|nr:TetR/AcrR family transcriptional regulator [Myxococcota bacterium]